MSIKISQIRYMDWTEDKDGGRSGSTTSDTIVKIENIEKRFVNDSYMYKARQWINRTFAEEQVSEIESEIASAKMEIRAAQERIEFYEKELQQFLVPVEIEGTVAPTSEGK